MKVRIGSAPDSWGVWFPNDARQTPWHRFLDEIAAAGYEWTETGPPGYLPTDPQVLRRELDQRGLKVCAGMAQGPLHDPAQYPAFRQEFLEAGAFVAEMGGSFLGVIPAMYSDLMTGKPVWPKKPDAGAWKHMIDAINELGRLGREQLNLTVVVHGHADTYIEYPEEHELLLEQTDPEMVGLCFDLGHYEYRGGDSVAFMRKHHARIPYLHLKSIDPKIRDETLKTKVPFATAVAMDMFCEPDRGTVDFPAFARLLKAIDYQGFAVVEQDMYPAPFDKPLPIAKRTREYLRSLELG